jgi:multidrug efflux pump
VNLTQFALKYHRLSLVAIIILLLWGGYAYQQLTRDVAPHFTDNTVHIITQLPNANPSQVQHFITQPLENLLQKMPIVEYVTSESTDNTSFITVRLQHKVKAQTLWQELHFALRGVDDILPPNTQGPYIHDQGQLFGIVLGITAEGFLPEEVQTITYEISQYLQSLNQVKEVQIYGSQQAALVVEYDPAQLARWQLTPSDIHKALQQQQIKFNELNIELDQEKIKLEIHQPETALEVVNQIVIPTPERSIFLHQVARVTQTYSLNSLKTHANGIPTTVLAISMQQSGDLTKISQQVRDLLANLKTKYPIGLDIQMITCQPVQVELVLAKYYKPLLIAVIITLILLLLMFGWQIAMMASLMLAANFALIISGLWLFGLQWDKLTITGLFIALIITVYYIITIVYAIKLAQVKAIANNLDTKTASLKALAAKQQPLFVTILLLCALFLPVFWAGTASLEYLTPIFAVVLLGFIASHIIGFSVIAAWLVSHLRVTQSKHKLKLIELYYPYYRAILMAFLRYRYLSAILVFTALGALFYNSQNLNYMFLPDAQCPYFKLSIDLPPTAPLEQTEQVVRQVEKLLHENSESIKINGLVTHWVSYIGGGGPRFIPQYLPQPTRSSHALLVVHVNNAHAIDEFATKLEHYAHKHFPDVRVRAQKIGHGVTVEHPIEVRISGFDKSLLLGLAQEVADKLRQLPHNKNIIIDWGSKVKKILVQPDAQRMRQFGVTYQDLQTALHSGFAGIDLTQYQTMQQNISVVLHEQAEPVKSIRRLENLMVYAQTIQQYVRLKQIADTELVWEYPRLLRRDGLYTMTVAADVTHQSQILPTIHSLNQWLENQPSKGEMVKIEFGGTYELAANTISAILPYILLSTLIILMLLTWQFNSINHPILLGLLPVFTLVLGLIGLQFMQQAVDFMFLSAYIIFTGLVMQQVIIWLSVPLPEHNFAALFTRIELHAHVLVPVLVIASLAVLPLWWIDCPLLQGLRIMFTFGLILLPILLFIVLPLFYVLLFRFK